MSIKTYQDEEGWKAVFIESIGNYAVVIGKGTTPEAATNDLLKESLRIANEILQDIKPEQTYAESLISKAKEHIIESKNSFACGFAEIQYKKGSIRYTYDTKKLNQYAEAYPEILAWRKTTEVKEIAALKWL